MSEQDRREEALDEAAGWIGRLRSDRVTREDKAAFSSWFARSERNRAAFDRLLAMWQDLAVLEVMPFEQNSATAKADRATTSVRGWWQFPMLRPVLAGGFAAAVAAVCFVLLLPIGAPTHQTTVGEQSTHRLADGSQLILNTNTQVDVTFDDEARALELIRGEAYFEVVSDPGRPFIVRACASRITAVGTAFNVFCEDGRLAVTVAEGQVSVSGASGINLLAGSEQLLLDEGEAEPLVRQVDPGAITAWRQQLHVYDGVPLRQVVEDLNRYSDTKIRVFDKSLAEIRVVARYRMADRESTLRSLEETFPLRVVRISDHEVALVPAP